MVRALGSPVKLEATMLPGQQKDDPEKKFNVGFHPLSIEELCGKSGYTGGLSLVQLGLRARHTSYPCGACGQATTGRVVCSVTRRLDDADILWCLCACEKSEPTIVIEQNGVGISQLPLAREFSASQKWPDDLARLYEEAAKAYAAGAFTAASMVCRKVLMSVACHQQEQLKDTVKEGETFTYYVNYLADKVLTFDAAKSPLEAIRVIGNEANHHLEFVKESDARRSLDIVQHMLNVIYSFPKA
jgi:hypothetical protein